MRLAILLFIIIGVFSFSAVYAQSIYVVNIPSGSADPRAPYFWQSEKDGRTDGNVQIIVGDTVRWENADTAAHTIVSGVSPALDGEGQNDYFDSGLVSPGKSFSFTFEKKGTFPYFCSLHPWMVGSVIVGTGYSVIPKVGSDVGDGKTAFDVEYQFNRVIADATVDEKEKAIIFTVVGKAKSDDNTLTLMLPKDLIREPYVIWVDGVQQDKFELESEGGINVVKLELSQKSERITIVGSHVVPEFGSVSMIVFLVSTITIIGFGAKIRSKF